MVLFQYFSYRLVSSLCKSNLKLPTSKAKPCLVAVCKYTNKLVKIYRLWNFKQKTVDRLPVFLSERGGRTTTCIVMTPPGSSMGSLDSASVLLFSNILPAFISFKSFTVLGQISMSAERKDGTSSENAKSISKPKIKDHTRSEKFGRPFLFLFLFVSTTFSWGGE